MTGTVLIRPNGPTGGTVGIVHADEQGNVTIAIPFVCCSISMAETALEQALALVRAAKATQAKPPAPADAF